MKENITGLNNLRQPKDTVFIGITPTGIKSEVDNLKAKAETGNEITGETLLKQDIEEIPCLLEPFLQQTGLACLAGSSDTGKSSLLRKLAIDISTGETHFLGFKLNLKHKSAIYVSTEDLQRETAFLLSKQVNDKKPEQLRSLRFVFDIEDLKNELDRRLTKKKADLIVIDCFSDVFGEDLKDTQKIRSYLHTYQDLALKHECLILFLHHASKRTESVEPSKHNLLSGQGFEAKMRLVIELRADLSDPYLRHLCIVKGNYLPANCKRESYVLRFDEDSFSFSNTGERVPFDFLIKQPDGDTLKAKYERAKELSQAGHNYAKIAELLGYKSKSSVSDLFQKAEHKGWN